MVQFSCISSCTDYCTLVACASFAVYYFAKGAMPDIPEASSAIGAAVVGLGGTLWSRLARGTAYTTQSVAILLLVPNGLAAAGVSGLFTLCFMSVGRLTYR